MKFKWPKTVKPEEKKVRLGVRVTEHVPTAASASVQTIFSRRDHLFYNLLFFGSN